MNIYTLIVAAIRKNHGANSRAAAVNIVSMTDEEVIRMMFSNYRGGTDNPRGLQLTQGGLAIMRSFFRSFPVTFPDQQIFSSYHILYLDRMCSMPWYATNDLPITIIFFEPDLAMRAKLVGDLDILLTAFGE